MYSLWQAHNSQESDISQTQRVTDVLEVDVQAKTLETPMNIISSGEISGDTINGLNTPDLTGVQITAAPSFVIRDNNNLTLIGKNIKIVDSYGNAFFDITYDDDLFTLHFGPGDVTKFHFHGTVIADNIPEN